MTQLTTVTLTLALTRLTRDTALLNTGLLLLLCGDCGSSADLEKFQEKIPRLLSK